MLSNSKAEYSPEFLKDLKSINRKIYEAKFSYQRQLDELRKVHNIIIEDLFKQREVIIENSKSKNEFWLGCLSNSNVISKFISNKDQDALKYLKSIKSSENIDKVILLNNLNLEQLYCEIRV